MNQGISKEVLSNLGNTNCIQGLNELSSNNDMRKNISDFCSDTTMLVGETWQKIKGKVSEYGPLLSQRSDVASSLSGAISAAIKLLLDYLGDDPYLTPEFADELLYRKQLAEESIASLQSKIDATYVEEKTDDDGNITRVTRNVYNIFDIREFRASITALEEDIAELNRLIEKISGLPAIYEEAKGIIEEAYAEIEKFSSNVLALQPSKTVTMV